MKYRPRVNGAALLRGLLRRDYEFAWGDGEVPSVTHPVGRLCRVRGPHPLRECTAAKYEPGPFPECGCAGHYSRVAANNEPYEGAPL